MNTLSQHIKSTFIKHSFWMHLTLALGLSYVIMQLTQLLGVEHFLGWFATLSFLSLPIYTFTIVREYLWTTRTRNFWFSWISVFVIYPLILFFLQIDVSSLGFDYLFDHDINGKYAYTTLAVLYLVLEMVLLVLDSKKELANESSWLTRLNPDRITVVLVILLCIFLLMSNNYVELFHLNDPWNKRILPYASYFVQLFAIYISYYVYYYLHHHFLFNTVLRKRGLIPYFIGLLLVILVVVPLHNLIISLFPVVDLLKLHPIGLVSNIFDDFNYALAITVLVISVPLIVTIEWYKQAKSMADLEQAKSRTELDLLRQQINPHFFFNTLNNLYAMSLTNEEETPATILQLSELMRYVIYKGKEAYVSVEDELKYIRDYIDLQMIRVHKDVELKVAVDVQNMQLQIPPLLYIILIENAFKHGIEPAVGKSFLYVTLLEKEGSLTFECENSMDRVQDPTSSGIGLENLKKRLSIRYPNRHSLIISKTSKNYKSTLTIEL